MSEEHGIWTISCLDGKTLIRTFKPASECSEGELMAVGFAKARGKWRREMGPLESELYNHEQEQKLQRNRASHPKED